MEFIKALHNQNEYNHGAIRRFQSILVAPDIYLSIQASEGFRCRPEITTDDLAQYTHWEMALLDKDQNFIRVRHILPNFHSLAEIELHFDESVYNYVPSDLVDELYCELRAIFDDF